MKMRALVTLMATALGFAMGGASAQSVNLQEAQIAEQETHVIPGAVGAEESVAEAGSSSADQRTPAV